MTLAFPSAKISSALWTVAWLTEAVAALPTVAEDLLHTGADLLVGDVVEVRAAVHGHQQDPFRLRQAPQTAPPSGQ
ncbi:hypothetical protein ACFWZ2_41025 [Streptomyces sp. NPDC059002]|uniref:hypothetical protein n=1 Tax=Streptomyces sp. NPDC059002 TaxID=3346690 RepID=UPI0036CA7885